jgi:dTDP-4-dehydrorhamnose 3,5-epimerase
MNKTIKGVKVINLQKIPDVRGTIMHGATKDTLLNDFGEVYFKKLYSGIINGWHVHEKLELNYICISGMIKLVMYDIRKKSPTYKVLQEVYLGDDNYCLVHIPPGVANAMQSLNSPSSIVCNICSEPHDPSIKYERINPNSKKIRYDWNKKNY